ncbi:50S ribosomal protein L31e [Candidatus Pacearchaeota archaeon]|nr:50S ribosomal protein L31e [Candidatus Pacearchaeota archaeon]MBI2057275.1 50S ribosomal protein L31e [Candidatus Pacearchaeota archaeon]
MDKKNIFEREYIIPLREKVRAVPRYKKTNKAVRTIKEFLARHMKVYDGNLNKIKIDKYLNEYLWFRGIRKPPYKVKVKAIKEGEIVKVELADLPEKLKFKKAREEKREQKGAEKAKEREQKRGNFLTNSSKRGQVKEKEEKKTGEKIEESPRDDSSKDDTAVPSAEPQKSEDKNKDGVEDKKEESEKKSAVVEAGEKFEKAEHKKEKHTVKGKTSSQERQEKNIYKKTHA